MQYSFEIFDDFLILLKFSKGKTFFCVAGNGGGVMRNNGRRAVSDCAVSMRSRTEKNQCFANRHTAAEHEFCTISRWPLMQRLRWRLLLHLAHFSLRRGAGY